MLSSKSREKKKIGPKRAESKELPESGVYHLQIRSIYGHIRSEISNTVPDIRRTEDTAYIRSYGLGQPYICVYGAGRQKAESPDRKQRAAHVRGV